MLKNADKVIKVISISLFGNTKNYLLIILLCSLKSFLNYIYGNSNETKRHHLIVLKQYQKHNYLAMLRRGNYVNVSTIVRIQKNGRKIK